MKKMLLTGLATEQSFTNPNPQCFLIFNDGEFKVPVTQEAAELVVAQMYTKEEEPNEVEDRYEHIDSAEFGRFENNSDEDGIDQV